MGRGPYFNIGEHVEGYSNFLLMLLLAPVSALGQERTVALAAKIIGCSGGALALLVTFALARRIVANGSDSPMRAALVGLLAAGTVAVSPAYAMHCTSGLETALFSVLVTAGVFLGLVGIQRSGWTGSGLAFAAAALTRPEGALVFTVWWMVQALILSPRLTTMLRDCRQAGPGAMRRYPKFTRCLLPDAAVMIVVVAGQLVFRVIAYDGEWLPNTYYAKVGGFWGAAPWSYIGRGVLLPILGPIGVILGGLGWLLSNRTWRWSLPAVVMAALGSLLPCVTGTDWMPGWRLVVPYLPLVAVVMAVGWSELVSRGVRRPAWLGAALSLVLVPAMWFHQDIDRRHMHAYTAIRDVGYTTGHAKLAEWLRTRAAKSGDTVALMDIGIVGYYCTEQRILDITGLTDRFIGKSPGLFMRKQFDPSYVLNRAPEFIVMTFSAEGDPCKPVPENAELQPWTYIEGSIWQHSDFLRHYVHKRSVDPGQPWTDQWARRLGAEAVFVHLYPGKHYLLVAFRRQA
jgi:hypothetical protein